MDLLGGNKSILKFRLIAPVGYMTKFWQLSNKLNATEWMGKEPESCRIIDFQQKEPVHAGQNADFSIAVGYRPHGWISDMLDDGSRRYNGWAIEPRDQKQDGTMLDGSGNPLTAGADPVYLHFNVFHLAEFNAYDFGRLESDSGE
ncbi:MAG: hypothetical protein H6822_02000 [Planctomycetaceae bacterium]|nr:hypothetical protein [Planctomycetales bacterium]MCB9920922.1 hypothetical protein [Planctomycetaceae bacterium]